MTFKKILNPVDGSEHSLNATRHAVTLAQKFNSKIILLHCHNRFPVVLSEPYFQQAIDEIMKRSETLVEPHEAILEESGVEFEVRILEGLPGSTIAEVVSIEKIDLVVMGSRGSPTLKAYFWGLWPTRCFTNQTARCLLLNNTSSRTQRCQLPFSDA